MGQRIERLRGKITRIVALLTTPVLLSTGVGVLAPARALAAACTPPSTDYGSASMTVNITTSGTYRAWSRVMAPDSTNNSYLLEVDGSSCFVVGDSAIPANAWTWVDYQNAQSSSKINVSLTAGNHTIKVIGREPNVKLDRTMFVSDLNCTPTGTGDNCATIDTTAPTVDLTAPADGSTVTGNVALTATAKDETGGSGLAKVEFYVDGALKSTATASPYTYTWNAATAANGNHLLSAKAYDAAGNSASDAVTVKVQNTDTQAPTVPASLTGTAPAFNKVSLSWKASTDNVAVTGYSVLRNGTPLAQVTSGTAFEDTSTAPNTTYAYQLQAFDAAGNKSALTSPVSVTTPNVADTQAPSVPNSLTASAINPNQVNLNWTASTDNTKVTAYDVYRAEASGTASKVVTVTTTSYGDTNLKEKTAYSYYVIARDAAGNSSEKSTTATVTTPQSPAPEPDEQSGNLRGRVTGSNGRGIRPQAHVTIRIEGTKHIFDTRTDGYYLIVDIPAGHYNVKYSGDGHRSQTISTRITDGRTKIQNVRLTRR